MIRAPVTGTILERAAEKGELVTSGFASTAEGGPQGLVVSLADLNDLQVELDIAQDDFAKLGPKQKGSGHRGCLSRPQVGRSDRGNLAAGQSRQGHGPGESADSESGCPSAAGHERHRKISGGRKQDKRSSQPQGVFVPTPAIHDRDGKKFVFLSFDGKAMIAGSENSCRNAAAARWCKASMAAKTSSLRRPQDLKDGDKIKIKGQS